MDARHASSADIAPYARHPYEASSRGKEHSSGEGLLRDTAITTHRRAGRSIVHLTSVHAPNDVRIATKECATLARSGNDVRLVAPHAAAPQQTSGESSQSFQVVPIRKRRSRWLRMTAGCLEVWRRAVSVKADLYHFHDPELFPVAIALRLMGKRVVYDAHEDLPKVILSRKWIPRPVRPAVARYTGWFERLAARALSGVVAATPTIEKRFSGLNTAVVRNYPRTDELTQAEPHAYSLRPPAVAYVGGITRERGVDLLLEAINEVARQQPVGLLLAGPIRPAAFEAELRQNAGWSHVDFRGWCDRSQIATLLGKARVGAVTLPYSPNHFEALPIKLFEYMAAGLPVVASDFPLWRSIVQQHRCGVLVDPTSTREIAEAIRWLLEHPEQAEEMGSRGRQAVVERLNWEAESSTLLEFYDRLLDGVSTAASGRREAAPIVRKSA